jgi:hypothetical protein
MYTTTEIKTKSFQIFQEIQSRFTLENIVRYIVQGIAVAIAAYAIPKRRTKFNEIATIASIAAFTLLVLDILSSHIDVE